MNTTPIWQRTSGETFPRLRADLEADVVVIGGGITGVTTAYLLTQAGKSVVLLESRRIASGVTGATTAHVTEVLDTRYHRLEQTFGLDGARLTFDAGRSAIELIERLSSATGALSFERQPGHLFAASEAQLEELAKERDALARLGATPHDAVLPARLAGRGAIRLEGQAAIDPVEYVTGLANHARKSGCRFFEETPVRSIDDGDPCTVVTADGATVKASQVVLATHSPLTLVFLQTKIEAYRSYVVAGPSDAPLGGLFWDLDDPYHYLRAASIGGSRYWIVGGEDHKTGQKDDTEEPFERLSAYARSLGLSALTHRWSAQVLEPIDGLPYIGASRGDERVLVATGFSGNGMTLGTIAARILTDACIGAPNRFAELFDAKRLPKASLVPAYVAKNVDFPIEFLKGTARAVTRKKPEDLAPGEGDIVHTGGHRLAVYRDEAGALNAVSAVCTHMGCIVAFNTAEKTWDCPCHGSRFRTDGTIIDGPAIRPLERVSLDDSENGG